MRKYYFRSVGTDMRFPPPSLVSLYDEETTTPPQTNMGPLFSAPGSTSCDIAARFEFDSRNVALPGLNIYSVLLVVALVFVDISVVPTSNAAGGVRGKIIILRLNRARAPKTHPVNNRSSMSNYFLLQLIFQNTYASNT